jgi:hypothetical protein
VPVAVAVGVAVGAAVRVCAMAVWMAEVEGAQEVSTRREARRNMGIRKEERNFTKTVYMIRDKDATGESGDRRMRIGD